MNTGLRITVFAAALAAIFGTAYGVGGAVDAVSPEPKNGAHSGPEGHAGAGHGEGESGGHEAVAPGGLQISQGGYTLDLKTPRLEAGKQTDLRFAVVQDGTGRNITAYRREHGKELHLILASSDLTVYRHLHPARAADGTWSTPVELPKAGGYRVFADFKPRAARRSPSVRTLRRPERTSPLNCPGATRRPGPTDTTLAGQARRKRGRARTLRRAAHTGIRCGPRPNRRTDHVDGGGGRAAADRLPSPSL